jgi:protein-tyrosine phosphatase
MVVLAAMLTLCSAMGNSQTSATPSLDATAQHPAPGTTITHFAQLDDGVYKGSAPKNDADYRFLQSKNIRYTLDLQLFPFLHIREKEKAAKYNITFLSARINASPLAPSEKHVTRILAILRDQRYRPIYFHCDLGRDRTSLIAALYRMYFLGASPQDAWQQMKSDGFKDSWTLRGLRKYLEKHPKPSPSLTAVSCRASHNCSLACGRQLA